MEKVTRILLSRQSELVLASRLANCVIFKKEKEKGLQPPGSAYATVLSLIATM
jgi:hypothetical protein